MRVVVRMKLLLVLEFSMQEVKHRLVTSTGLLVVPGMRNGMPRPWRTEFRFICVRVCEGVLKLKRLLSRITLRVRRRLSIIGLSGLHVGQNLLGVNTNPSLIRHCSQYGQVHQLFVDFEKA
jgi:hypothetical protein